jgi:hypothetical protein
MEGEREQTRDQNEGGGQQQPLGKQNENQTGQSNQQQFGQSGQRQATGQGGQQPLDQQGDFGSQEPGLSNQGQQEYGHSGGQSATGQSQDSDTQSLNQDEQEGLGGGASDLGGGETGQGSSGFVGNQGQDSGEYLQQQDNPQSGFAEQGRGASNQNAQDSDSGDSDIDGSNGSI